MIVRNYLLVQHLLKDNNILTIYHKIVKPRQILMKVLYVTNNKSRHLSICVLRELILTLVARGFVTRLKRRVSLVEQELLTLPEHLNSPPVFSGVHVTRTLVLYVCFVDRCFFCCTLSFDPCVFCFSSIYGF